MKKSLLVLAIASTLAACGGGGGGSTSSPVATTPVVKEVFAESYVDQRGGNIGIGITNPQNLPSWIKHTTLGNIYYTIEPNNTCTTRVGEIANADKVKPIVQTSVYQCIEPDFISPANFDWTNSNKWDWSGKSNRLFTNSINDPRMIKVDGFDWPKKRGQGQIMIQVQKGDCDGTDCTRTDGARDRAELGYFPEGFPWFPNQDKEYWTSFSFYVPKPYKEQGNQPNTSGTTTIFQIITCVEYKAEEWYKGQPPGPIGATGCYPFLQLGKYYDQGLYARTWSTLSPRTETGLVLDKEDFSGRWHDVVVKYRPWVAPLPANDLEAQNVLNVLKEAPYTTLEVYINGIKKVETKMRSLISKSSMVGFKIGLYRPTSEENITQTIFFDEIRVGNSRAEVDLR